MLNRFAVLGNPIAHSLSPLIHQEFAKQTGVQLVYEKIQVTGEQFEEQVASFFNQGGRGLNITLPFKQKAFAMAACRTSRCQQAKAANTLWMHAGQLHADNTDGVGFIRDLAKYQDLLGKHVLLLGAGGAARGIIGPLLAAGITDLAVVNRTKEKAQALQADFPTIQCYRLEALKDSYEVIINATSASLTEKTLNLPAFILQSTSFCYDLAYSLKSATPFVAWAQAQGARATDGLGMLVEQAAEAFFIWHGIKPNTLATLSELKTLTAWDNGYSATP